ncbi:MAG: ATP-binding protein [Clostridia bacterium]|jgi:PAS domain S-box-containing protein
MNWLEENDRNKLNELIVGVKIFVLFFSAVAVFSNMNIAKTDWLSLKYVFVFCILPAIIIFEIWRLTSRNWGNALEISWMDVLDTGVFLAAYTLLVLFTGGHSSYYKDLFFFCVITSTVQYGMRYGIGVAILSALIITAVDLFSMPFHEANPYFQSDLILIGVFFLTAYLLSYYQKMLGESEERYRKLLEILPDGIVVNIKGENVYMNPAVGKIFHTQNRSEIMEYLSGLDMAIPNGQDTGYYEKEFTTSCGCVLALEITPIQFIYNGVEGILGVIRDVTARKRIGQIQYYDKLRTDFFANLSHEFRTPLNVILGTLQLLSLFLKNSVAPESAASIQRYIGIMKQNCNRLLRLVSNLIDITKIDAGFLELKMKNYDIVSLAENITMSVADYIHNKGLSIQFDTDMEELIIACDPDQIERVILNLLSNAIKFTPSGGSIFVTIHDGGDWVQISVKDTGIGIPKEEQPFIFERFKQVNQSLSRNHTGSGIGLSLIKSIVEMHQGQITLSSEVNRGSTFTVELPVRRMEEEEQAAELAPAEKQDHTERIHIEFSDIYTSL